MEESPMVFEHPSVKRSWVTYEIGKDRSMATILHVEPQQGGTVDYRPVHEKSWRYRSCGRFAPEHRLMYFGLIWHGERHG